MPKGVVVGGTVALLGITVAVLPLMGDRAAAVAPASEVVAAQGASTAAGTLSSVVASEASTAVLTTRPALPFNLPSTATLRSRRPVFAHYMSSLPVSLDNVDPLRDYYTRNYLNPTGESGVHAAYGGFLRDRPLTRSALASTDWQAADLRAEVRQAIAGGIDGFALDLMQLPGGSVPRIWDTQVGLLKAAQAVDPGFKIMLVPDMTSSVGRADPAGMARMLCQLGAYPAAYRLADRRLVVSPFYAESKSVTWWQQVMAATGSQCATTLALVPMFLNEQPVRDAFAPISYGMANWGARNPWANNPDVTYSTSPIGRAGKVHELGKIWMQPVSAQDERPKVGLYEEAENTTNLRNTWEIARASRSEWAQLATWNDYTEGTMLAPTKRNGWAWLDLNAYFLTWFKTGSAPTIVRDAVYLTHRVQPVSAKPQFAQTTLMALRSGNGSPARNTVEAMTFLTAPATVTITVGSATYAVQAPAGVSTHTVPLSTGTVSAQVKRGGATVATAASPNRVTTTPYVQDLSYVAVGGVAASTAPAPTTSTSTTRPSTTSTTASTTASTTISSTTRSSTTTGAPAPTTGTAPSGSRTVTLAPIADTFANEGAPATNFGTSASLSSRGHIGAASYLRFALPTAPAGTRLTRVTLRLRTTTLASAGSTEAHTVRPGGDGWSESTLTWAQRPGATGAALGTIAAGTRADQALAIGLDAAATAPWLGSRRTLMVDSTGDDSLWFWSSNHPASAYRPQLVLEFG